MIERKDIINQLWRSNHKKICEKVIEPGLENGAKVLDVGAGTGLTSDILRSHGYNPTAVDLEANILFDVPEVNASGTHLPFANRSANLVVSQNALHHYGDYEEQEQAIGEFVRVADKIIVVETPANNKMHRVIVEFFDRLMNWEWGKQPHNYRGENEWCKLLKSMGLEVQTIDLPLGQRAFIASKIPPNSE